jgi:hypothetical protein
LAGKQFYLLALAEPQLVSNFEISGAPASGTITIYGEMSHSLRAQKRGLRSPKTSRWTR